MRALLGNAGFEFTREIDTHMGPSIIEGRPHCLSKSTPGDKNERTHGRNPCRGDTPIAAARLLFAP
jgi:hypothetical protein